MRKGGNMLKNTLVIVGVVLLSTVLHAQGWHTQTSGTNALLMDVHFSDPYTGWVVGITNTILHTTNGGDDWNPQNPPPSVNYYSVFFTDDQIGHAVGATVGGSGRIRHTTDGGNTWEPISINDGYSLWSVFFINDTTGWIAGGREPGFLIDPIRTIHYTNDGGYTWGLQLYQYDSLALHDVHFTNEETGCVVGEHGTIFWTTDGGNNWIQQYSGTVQHLWGIRLLDEYEAWAVGVQGTILRTSDAGITWVPQNIDSIYGFRKVFFADANNGWMSGGDNDTGIVLHTTDSGVTWETQYTSANTFLMSIYFTDADTGWAVGNIGTIVHTTTGGTGVTEDFVATIDDIHIGSTISRGPLRLPKIGKCRLFDITGREVHNLNPVSGIYFIEVKGVITQKVIKVR
jgi:photosystem II stability/assembly factor-like uncharacterized protein